MAPREVFVYARQSLDRTGAGMAIDRQVKECRAFARAKGWRVAKVFSDNDISATTGAARPGFEALLKASPEAILVWHIDRLVRLTKDLERVIELGVPVHAVKAGELDLSNPAGRAVARTITAWATYEGEQKALRQAAANRQRAEAGEVGWTRRPFGFDREDGQIVVVEAEAAELRKAAARVLAGATLASIVKDLNVRGVRTSTGSAWTVTGIRRLLLNPRTAGHAVYRGSRVGEGAWPAIIEDDTQKALAAILRDPARRKQTSTKAKHLLSGIAVCGICDETMMASASPRGPILRCPGLHLSRLAAPIEAIVEAVILERLSRPDAAGLFASGEDVADLQAEADVLRTRQRDLAALLAEGLLPVAEVREQARALGGRLGALEDRIQAALGQSPGSRLAASEDARGTWAQLGVTARKSIVRELLEVRVLPAGKGARFSPRHLDIRWRRG
ncbi:recombinase family protein [Knoellia sp. p5-6-4]|uniref:recombinase family protein n=1 Tax=unclassified Knoellia TaxID=2618719 RepID=UPI0023DC7959|nr:recombinase family protein [Knoellia sp. p5-6-4]MDF2146349.1 recombinase family protein [Knoellia sp. p5-6-4]